MTDQLPADDAASTRGVETFGPPSGTGPAHVAPRLLLFGAVLASLAGLYSYGLFTTPPLLVPLWLAARSGGRIAWAFWVLLALPCALLTGMLIGTSLSGEPPPFGFALALWLGFALTTALRRAPAG